MKRTVWLLGALAACGGPSTPAGGPAVSVTSLGDELLREVGNTLPVAILPGSTGLVAMSADGARSRVLVAESTPWAIVDARSNVVWFGSPDGSSILALDLTVEDAAPEVMVTGLPTETDAGMPIGGVRYGEEASHSPGHPAGTKVVVNVAAQPTLTAEGMMLELWEQLEPFEQAVQEGASLVGAARIAEYAARAEAGGGAIAEPQSAPRVTTIDVSACAESEEECGTAEVVTGTNYWRVVTSFSCGDACYRDWHLYDPATQQLHPAEWATLSDAWVAPDGSAWVTSGVITRFDTGPVARDGEGGAGGGWIGGGSYYGF